MVSIVYESIVYEWYQYYVVKSPLFFRADTETICITLYSAY